MSNANLRHSPHEPPLDESDLLIRLATRGDPDAIAAVVIQFGSMRRRRTHASRSR